MVELPDMFGCRSWFKSRGGHRAQYAGPDPALPVWGDSTIQYKAQSLSASGQIPGNAVSPPRRPETVGPPVAPQGVAETQ
jgi:hypothetical protein